MRELQSHPTRQARADSRSLAAAVGEPYTSAFRETLRQSYFSHCTPEYLASPEGQHDVQQHVSGRMLEFESVVVPWVEEGFTLSGKRVLEIGCGTGSSTLPVAWRAESVTACDLGGPSLEAARERARLLGVGNITFRALSPDWAQSPQGLAAFQADVGEADVVLLIALLEHLLPEERLGVLRTVWRLLRPGGIMVVYETPNRLCSFDWHSFQLPFFDSLPDALALEYAQKTPRAHFRVGEHHPVESLYRIGRGVGFHEFELAIGLEQLHVLADGFSPRLRFRDAMEVPAFERGLCQALRERLPHVPLGFARPSLDFVFQKAPGSARPTKEAPRHPALKPHDEDARLLALEQEAAALRATTREHEEKAARLHTLEQEVATLRTALPRERLKHLLPEPALKAVQRVKVGLAQASASDSVSGSVARWVYRRLSP